MNIPRTARLLSYVDHVARLRAKLAKDLLETNPDQEADARAWGDRDRRRA